MPNAARSNDARSDVADAGTPRRSWFIDLSLQWKAGIIVGILVGMFMLQLGANAVVREIAARNLRRAYEVKHLASLGAAAAREVVQRRAEAMRLALSDPGALPVQLPAATAAVAESLSELKDAVAGEPTLSPLAERADRLAGRWADAVGAPLAAAAASADPAERTAAMRAFLLAEDGEAGARGIIGALDELSAAAEAQISDAQTHLRRSEEVLFLIDALALIATLAASLGGLLIGTRLVSRPLTILAERMARLAARDHAVAVPYTDRRDEVGTIARALAVFKTMAIETGDNDWVKGSANAVLARLQLADDLPGFADALLAELAPRLEAGVGAFYRFDAAAGSLSLLGGYALPDGRDRFGTFRLGEGIVGQCGRELKPIILSPVPQDHVRIRSGTGTSTPRAVVAAPLVLRERLIGVIELGCLAAPGSRGTRLLAEILPLAALDFDNLARALETRALLEASQKQAGELRVAEEELRIQQEELRATNEQLHERTQRLAASEEELRVQAEELAASNDVLRRTSEEMTAQKDLLEALNLQLEARAEELVRANDYKSQFLANMSHELRTPLNSLLILSQDLAENRSGNLDADQVEAAAIIHASGSNLLRLINDILDLSKVEAGKMEVVHEPVTIAAFAQRIERNFRRLAQDRRLRLTVSTNGAPQTVHTDPGKLEQILTNLVGNALKFTLQGRVSVEFTAADAGATLQVAVIDSGIGIPADKLDTIFEAFEQVDSSTRRQFGGTGLGLAITQRLAQLLGGSVQVASTPGQGSTFTLRLPVGEPAGEPPAGDMAPEDPAASAPPRPALAAPERAAVAGLGPTAAAAAPPVADDRDALTPGGTVILVVEDDPAFARTLAGLVRRKGYQVLAASDGESGLALARRYRPTGILLDVMLPGMDGWTVIQQLKASPETRHIPVHFVSALEEGKRGRDLGAAGFLTKPVGAAQLSEALGVLTGASADRPRRVLVVDDDPAARHAVRTLLAREAAEILEAGTGEEALAIIGRTDIDCMVLDLGLPGVSGFDLIEQLAARNHHVPVVVYSGRDLTTEERLKLRAFTDSIVVKGALSPERLLDEVTLFLHSVRHEPKALADNPDGDLEGRKLLLVDDDMRNIYALAKVLRVRGIQVVLAQDGAKALAQLNEQPDIEIVLMDVMMPVMDGYEAMAQIRQDPRFAGLPVIALTAKAMKDDREKCLAAGASDYLAKPVDVPKLLSMLRTWLPPR